MSKGQQFDMSDFIKNSDGTFSKRKTVEQPREVKLKQQGYDDPRLNNVSLNKSFVEHKPKRQTRELLQNQLWIENNKSFGLCCQQLGISPQYIIDMPPFPAPRMSRSDQWKTDPNHKDPKKRQRVCVTRYWANKNRLMEICAKSGYNLTPVLNIAFFVEMPESWSMKKKREMLFTKHQQRPDRDNYLKAFQDSFPFDDGFVWDGRSLKVWSDKPMIVIF